ILLSLGLLMAFAMPAAAVDVKFSGSYYAMGWYLDNPSLLDKGEVSTSPSWNTTADSARRSSSAWYGQRFRLETEFQVVEGLKLVTRIDALEKKWGDQAWAGGVGETQSRTSVWNGTANQAKIQENLEFERAYLDFNVPFGKFQVGYMQFLMWGTDFLNTPLSAGGIRYYFSKGPWMAVAAVEKRGEYLGLTGGKSGASAGGSGYMGQGADADKDVYDLGAIYKFGAGEVGLLYQYNRASNNKFGYVNGYTANLSGFFPYTKLTFGNFFVEGEGVYGFGNLRSYENNGATTTNSGSSVGAKAQDIGLSALGLFLHGKYDLKPAYVGLQFVYLSGDDNQNSDKATGNVASMLMANYGFNRTLMLWNSDYGDNMGSMKGNIPAATAANRTGGYQPYVFQDNCWFYQAYVGVKPMAKMDIKLAFSIANADKKPKSDVGAVGSAGYYGGATVREFQSSEYGKELDLTASYKIYDNLTYMIGAGYLWTGDYFKGYDSNVTVSNNYLLSHKLTLNF
ncbi:MAG: hypothetical protein WCW53_11135, partial [Syntrophales bacterium]